jgi:hypothetical protein
MDNGCHAGTGRVDRLFDVVDDRTPGQQVGGNLVNQLLAIERIALVRVEGNQLVIIDHEERLPDRRLAIVGDGAATSSYAGDEFPCVTLVAGRIDINLGHAEIGRDRTSSTQYRAFREAANSLREFVQEWLVTQTPAIDGVGDIGDVRPSLAAISGLEDWEIDSRWFVGVVLPSGE